MSKPIILLAFANDRKGEFLRSISSENQSIQKALSSLVDNGLYQLTVLPDASVEDITDAFRTYKDRIVAFHYGGHAEDLQLILKTGKLSIPDLAEFLAEQKGLQMVFMNGCATADQQDELTRAGIPNLILTDTSINDWAAKNFASLFYQNLASGRNAARSFNEAAATVQMEEKGGNRGLLLDEEIRPDGAIPWSFVQNGSSEWALQTQKPFPWKFTLIATFLVIALGGAGYYFWKANAPFDQQISFTFPEGTDSTHFSPPSRILFSYDGRAINEEIPYEGGLMIQDLKSMDKPQPFRLESVYFTVGNPSFEPQRNTVALKLDWSEHMKTIQGEVKSTSSSLDSVLVQIGPIASYTDQNGRFRLQLDNSMVPKIRHQLKLSKKGYQSTHMTVNLADKQENYIFYLDQIKP